MKRPEQRAPASVRVYEWLLGRLPGGLTEDARAELLQVFTDQHTDINARYGRFGLATMWLRTLYDLARSSAASFEDAPTNEQLRRTAEARRMGMGIGTTVADGVKDARIAVRSLSKDLGFTLTAVAILGLGIGANTTVFTLVNNLFLEPPPDVVEPDRLVRLNRTTQGSGFGALAYPDYAYYRDNNEVFDGVFAYDPDGVALSIGVTDRLTAGRGWMVSHNYFDVLGVRPVAGRWFREDEDRTPGTHSVAIVSHTLATTLFGNASNAVGASLSLNGNTFSVIGVPPPTFRGTSPTETPPDVWVPIHAQPILTPLGGDLALRRVSGETWLWLWAVGRLRDDITTEAAQGHMDGLARYLEENFAEWNADWGVVLSPGSRFHPPNATSLTTMTLLLFGVVAAILLIACANLAILLLARGSAKVHDVGMRLALGASRGRVVRALLIESLLLAFTGAALGVAMTYWSADVVAAMLPMGFAISFEPDWTVVLFAVLLATATAALFGVIPAWQVARADVQTVLKGIEHAPGMVRGRNALVVTQVALSLMLVTAAGLCTKSLFTARSIDLGFETENRLLLTVNLGNHGYTEETGRAFIGEALGRLRAVPEVRAASTMRMVPFRGTWSTSISPPGSTGAGEERVELGLNAVSPDYFTIMGIPLLMGRAFTNADVAGSGINTAVINREMAEMYWPNADPIGQTFGREGDREGVTVIGVAENAHLYALGEETPIHAYVPVHERYASGVTFLIDAGGSSAVAALASTALHEVDPSLAFISTTTMDDVVGRVFARYRVAAMSVGIFGILALGLASAGLFGVLSYMVSRRKREIGVRVALGASGLQVGRTVVGKGLALAAIGVALGLAGSIAGAEVLTSFLYQVNPRDPLTLLAAPLILLLVAAAASLVPAWRATSVQPVDVLKSD